MAHLQYFASGLTAIGVFAVIASLVSPDQGGPGTIVLGVAVFFVGIAIFVFASRRGSGAE